MFTAEEKDSLLNQIRSLYETIDPHENNTVHTYNSGYNQAISKVIELVKSTRTDTSQAEWIDHTEWIGSFGMCKYTCSACGFTINEKPFSAGNGKGSKYCEECGARMSTEIRHKQQASYKPEDSDSK